MEDVVVASSKETEVLKLFRRDLHRHLPCKVDVITRGRPKPPDDTHSVKSNKVAEVLQALEAALEVNDHLNREIERKTAQLEDTTKELQGYKQRCEQLSHLLDQDRVKSAAEEPRPEPAAAPEVPDVKEECLRGPHSTPLWDDPAVQSYHEKLVHRGAEQGWLLRAQEITLGDKIGSGTFGTTYMGDWRGAHVAVKCIHPPESATELINFFREVDAFACLTHPNVLPFLGACLSKEQCWLVTDYMSGGTLKEWLYGADGYRGLMPSRTLSQRLSMGLQVAQGMSALEASEPPIVHRDLKPSNVFIDDGGHARIADLNLSRRLYHESLVTLTGETGTYLYMSPEVMRHEMYTTMTDIFSFGVMLVELCNQRLPYSSLYLTPVQVAMAVADKGLRPPIDVTIPRALRQLIEMCLEEDPLARPTFVTIVRQLRDIVAEVVRQEEAAAAARAGSLFGRMQGMIAGAVDTARQHAAQQTAKPVFGFMRRG